MLSNKEIKRLSAYLNEDIKKLKLNKSEIQERAVYYLENISGLEVISDDTFQDLMQSILDHAKVPKE